MIPDWEWHVAQRRDTSRVLLANELAAARALHEAGVMFSFPGSGHLRSEVFNQWGVYAGSHGGHAKTLKAAMRRCLKCCDIGEFWKTGYNEETRLCEGPYLRNVFEEIAEQHLGGLGLRK